MDSFKGFEEALEERARTTAAIYKAGIFLWVLFVGISVLAAKGVDAFFGVGKWTSIAFFFIVALLYGVFIGYVGALADLAKKDKGIARMLYEPEKK